MMTCEESFIASEAAGGESQVFRGLLWREWLRMRGWVVWALTFWLVLIWVLLLAGHPGVILAFGMVYVLIGSVGFAAGDVMEGSEEFAFALPPTRAQQYLARLVLGLGTTIAFSSLGVLSVGLDLPQRLWGIFVESGLTVPFPVCEERLVYGLAMALPAAAFSCIYALSANAGTRSAVFLSAVAGTLLAAAVMGAGFIAETALWDRVNGYVSVPVLLAAVPMALLAGYGFYLRKEGVNRPTPLGGTRLTWVWVLVALGILVLLMAFFWIRAPARLDREEEILMRTRQEEALMRQQADLAAPRPADQSPEDVGIRSAPADNATENSQEDGR